MTKDLTKEEEELEQLLLSHLTRMNATVNGIVLGLLFGGLIFFATIWLVLKGGDIVGPNLSLLGQFFIGYEVTWLGSIIGFLYGFVLGFSIGFLQANIYNWIANKRVHAGMKTDNH